jgi:nicotinamidase-related amidase
MITLSLRWALLVIDMQNDFLDAGGYYARRAALQQRADWSALSPDRQARLLEEGAQAGAKGPRSPAVVRMVANVSAAIAAARKADRPVAFIRAVYGQGFDTLPPLLANDPDRQHFPCKPGTWGTGFFGDVANAAEEAPRPSERVFEKHTYDAFTCPSLPTFLEEREVDTVFVCGTETQVCVLATAQRAALLGYRTFILEDAVWSVDSAKAGAALAIFRDAFGNTLTVDALGSRAAMRAD